MADEEKAPTVSLFNDVLGLGAASDALISAIRAGVGHLWEPYQRKRLGRASFDLLDEARERFGVTEVSRLTVAERGEIRVLMENSWKQERRESVARATIEEHMRSTGTGREEEIDLSWLEYFWDKAESVSDAHMQVVWGKLLSRRIRGEQYNLRTLDMLRVLSNDEIEDVVRLAPFVVCNSSGAACLLATIDVDFYPDYLPWQPPRREKVFELSSSWHWDLERLTEAGFFVDEGFANPLWAARNQEDRIMLSIGNKSFELTGGDDPVHADLLLGTGTVASRAGRQLFSLADQDPNEDFLRNLTKKIEEKGLLLVER